MIKFLSPIALHSLLCIFALTCLALASPDWLEIQSQTGSSYTTSEGTLQLNDGVIKFHCKEKLVVTCLGQKFVCDSGSYELVADAFKGELKVVDGNARLEIAEPNAPGFTDGQVFTWEAIGQRDSQLLHSLGMCE